MTREQKYKMDINLGYKTRKIRKNKKGSNPKYEEYPGDYITYNIIFKSFFSQKYILIYKKWI